MIILKILLWILLAIIGIVVIFLAVPVSAEVSYIDKKLDYKIKYGFMNMYDSKGKGLAKMLLDWRKKKKSANEEEEFFPEPEEYGGFEEPEIAETDEDFRNSPEYEPFEEEEESPAEEIPEDTKEKSKKEKKSEKNSDGDSKIDKFLDKIESLGDKLDFALDLLRSADKPLMQICKGFKFSHVYIDFMIADEDAYKCALKYGRISGAVYPFLGWLNSIFSVKFKTVDIFPDFREKESRWDISAKFSFNFITPVVAGIYFLLTYIFKFFIPQKMKKKNSEK